MIETITMPDKNEQPIEYIVIHHGDGSTSTMLKEIWDEQQKAAELGGTL